MKLLANLTNNIWLIIFIILLTTLVMNVFENRSLKRDLIEVNNELVVCTNVNSTLNETVNELRKELETKPDQFITITKEVEKEVCDGKVKQEMINSLPSKREVQNESNVGSNVADIDDRLPDELVRLLK